MKNTKPIRIITVALSCLLLIGAVIGISVSAASETTVEIKYKNLAYEGAIQVLYAVDAQNVPADASVQMRFYDSKDAENYSYVKDEYIDPEESLTINGITYRAFFSKGIAPKNMRAPIFAKAVVVDAKGAVIAESEMSEYSVYTYATNRFKKNPTDDQFLLYTAMLDYGANVQRMLVESEKITEQDVIDNGGWINAYCGIRQDISLDGETVAQGEVSFYTPGEVHKLVADNMYGDGVFVDFSDPEGNSLGDGAYPKKSVIAKTPGIAAYTANYEVTGFKFETFDDYLIDGSANDVNVLYKGKTYETARKNFGVYALNNTFGNAATASTYQRIDKDSTDPTNQVYLVGANGTAGGNAFAFALERKITGADKYIIQFDFNYHGRTDTVGDNPVWFRPETEGFNDQYDIRTMQMSDSGASSSTFRLESMDFSKNTKYTFRFEITPKNRAYYDLAIYVDGVLLKTLTDQQPDATFKSSGALSGAYDAVNNINNFIGIRFFNRKSTDYSYEFDNVYIGVEGSIKDKGTYFNDPDISADKKYDFGAGTTVSDVVYPNSGFSAAKVEDGVFYTAQSGGFKNKNSTTGDKYVFETDFMYEAGTITKTLSNPYLGWVGMSNGASNKTNDFAAFYLPYTYDSATGKVTSINLSRYEGNHDTLATFYPDTWYNIRIEYTPANITTDGVTKYYGIVDLYINGVLSKTYTAAGYANSNTILAQVSNEAFSCFNMEIRGSSNSGAKDNKFYFDNMYMSAVDAYVAGNGEYYNNTELAGTRYDYEGLTADTVSSVLSSDSSNTFLKESTAGYLSFKHRKINGDTSCTFGIANAIPEGAEALPKGNVHVFETDIRFMGGYRIAGGDSNLGWFGLSAGGSNKIDHFVPFALDAGKVNEIGEITTFKIRDFKTNSVVIAELDVDKWYNLRVVYTADNTTDAEGNVTKYGGTVEFYINNELVTTYTTSGYSISDSDFEPNEVLSQVSFQFRTMSSSGTSYNNIRFDNTYFGTFTK